MKRTFLEVTSWNQLKELEALVEEGVEFPRTFGISHLGKLDTVECACLCGLPESAGELEIDVAYGYLDDVLGLLDASCVFEHTGCEIIVGKDGASIWRGNKRVKFVRFKQDFDMALKFQKTQYKAKGPFALARFALDPLWSHWFSSCFEKTGWAAA